MSYPTINLTQSYTISQPVVISTVKVLQIAESPESMTLDAFIEAAGDQFWINILTQSNYHSDWTDNDVSEAIKLYYLAKYS